MATDPIEAGYTGVYLWAAAANKAKSTDVAAVRSALGGLSFDAPEVDAVAVKQLGAPAFWRSQRDFTATMESLYHAFTAHARRLAMEDD